MTDDFDINREHARFRATWGQYENQIPILVCRDGFRMSVQANRMSYCSPRVDGADRYDAFEVGYPNRRIKALLPYADDPNVQPTKGVYAEVPAETINAIVVARGGVARWGYE